MRIIVLDCYSRMGLAVINALDRSYDLIGGAAGNGVRRHAWADRRLRSPRLSGLFRYPHANVDPAGFRKAIVDACASYEPDAIFPASTATALGLSRLTAELGSSVCARFVTDDYDRLRHLADKWLLYELSARLDIPTPRTVLASECFDSGRVGLPCLAKPRLAEGTRGVRFVQTSDELASVLADPRLVGAPPDDGHPYIVQELIPGSITNVGACAVRGRPVSLMTQRRLFTRFEFGGTGIVHRTTHEPVIMEYAERLLAELEWSGPVLFEFIASDDGRYYLIDGNPRVWASTDLTVACGMNICQQAVDILVRGLEPEAVLEYKVGLTMRWLSPQAVGHCFRRPRRPSAMWKRLSTLLFPRRPSTTITNLRRGNFRHLLGIAVDSAST